MPEERKEEAEAGYSMEDDGEVETPADILPLFFTSKTQEIFGCKGDEDVTEENPHKLIPKEAILQDFKDRAANYPADELLVVYDPVFKYGQNFYLALTEEAKERILNDVEEEDVILTLTRFPRTPQPWVSYGSEVEVEEENVTESRSKVRFRISRKRREFGAPVHFSDRNVSDAKDGFVECPSYEDESYGLMRKELDKGIQAVPELTDIGNQTEWRKPRNAVTQYTPRTTEEKSTEEINKSTDDLLSFIDKVTPRFQLALQQNEILDVFYDDYSSLADDETTFGAKSDNYLKEYQSFTDLQYSKEKTITDIQWHPVMKGIIAVSCGEGLSFDDRVDNFSRILMTSSLLLIWSFSDPIHPLIILWDITNHSDRLRSHRQSHGQSKKNSMNSLPGFEDETSFDRTPILRYSAVSSIEHSHKTVIGRMGVVVENKAQQCNQLMSCAADGLQFLTYLGLANLDQGNQLKIKNQAEYRIYRPVFPKEETKPSLSRMSAPTPRPEQVWAAHDGPIATLQRSPFFRNIILTVGGWTFAIWREGVASGPLLQSASHLMRLTKGHWSPSRPGVFFITRTDGSVDVWDLLDRSHEPSLTQNVTASPITTIAPHQVSSKQQLLAVGDNVGTLHVMEVPWNLRHPSSNEAVAMENFFEREMKRLAFVEERMKIRAQEKIQRDAEETKRQQEGKKPEENEADLEARQRMEYQEYLEMEKRLLEELGVREDSLDSHES
ncbi:Dynein axonemal intermediate chain 3 [Acropora cervicornis]|uniref:Dynein axonemal intermediate chain 3 n=1 Tax=Acropora cervicornis TaxID=6130 RepID=A0AAD9QYY8_ACRCE|nr:Dynein axonemal intermediate chain 3 [Acropora cervicornis]